MALQWGEMADALGAVPAAATSRHDTPQVFISYAWADDSNKIAELELAFQNEGVHVVRDKRDLGYKGNIREFMAHIGRGKCVLLILSEEYLRSENCLFELLEVAKHGDFADGVFPVVLESARIYKPLDRIRYVRYWEKQITDLDEELKTVSAANMHGFRGRDRSVRRDPRRAAAAHRHPQEHQRPDSRHSPAIRITHRSSRRSGNGS